MKKEKAHEKEAPVAKKRALKEKRSDV